MKKDYIYIISLLTVLMLNAGIVKAANTQLDSVMEIIMNEVKNSDEFKKSMSCLGVSVQKRQSYLEQYEKDYRYCLNKYPQNKDDGAAFLSCWIPKIKLAVESLGFSESQISKCMQ